MPQSDHWALPFVLEVVGELKPSSVLDFGVGLGQYGVHLRQLLEIGTGRLQRDSWIVRIDGVELFEPYRNPIWGHYYDSVAIVDGREFLSACERKYDVALFCDVIEHFDADEAKALLHRARQVADWVLVTTPNGEYEQGAVFGNEAERHRSTWQPDDFRNLGAAVHEIAGTFLAVFAPPGGDAARAIRDLPGIVGFTGGSLAVHAAKWLPRALRSRFGGR